MQPTTDPGESSRTRIIYHTPGKSFAWLHKDGSFADFQKALRTRLNISKDEPLVIKQIDGDYTLDIETEEEYAAFCHFTKSTSQLHVSVNGGLRDQSKVCGVGSTALSSGSAPRLPAESEDPTLGKRKASYVSPDPEAPPFATQKRKKRRKVGHDQSISAAENSATIAVPPELEAERGAVSGSVTHHVTSGVPDPSQSTIPAAKKKRRKRKSAATAQTDSLPVELPIDPAAEPIDASEPSPAQPSNTKKRKKTVVVDLAAVIPPPEASQESPPTPTALRPSPIPVTASSSSTAEAARKPLTRKKSKIPAELPEPIVTTPSVPPPGNVDDESAPLDLATKSNPPVSKPGLPRQEVYVEIITKKRKTGKLDGSSTVERESKQQVMNPPQPTVEMPNGNPRKLLKRGATKRIECPNAPSIQEIMDGVIAAAMDDAKKRVSTSENTTDVGESFASPPREKPKRTARRLEVVNTSSPAPVEETIDPGFTTSQKKARTRKPSLTASLHSRKSDGSSLVPRVQCRLDDSSPAPSSTLKGRAKSNTPPPPNQRAIQKQTRTETPSDETTSTDDEDSDTPKKNPAPIFNPDDELDAFLYAPVTSSQKSILEDLPSDSEIEEEEMEREDMEVDEDDDAGKQKGTGYQQLKVIGRVKSSADDSDSDSDSLDTPRANQANVKNPSHARDIVPSSDLEDEEELLSRPRKSTDASIGVPLATSSPGRRMTSISNLKSANQALNFFNEHVLDKPDPIENDSGSPKDLPKDPILNADPMSTPKPRLSQREKGGEKITSPVVTRKDGPIPNGRQKQSGFTSPNMMLPPPDPSRRAGGDLTFTQPLDQSTPVVPGVSRKKRPAPGESPSLSEWAVLPQGEQSGLSTGNPSMIDELDSSSRKNTSKSKATPVRMPTSEASTKQTPLFLPGTSQYPVPSSDLPVQSSPEESEDEEEERKTVVSLSSAIKNKVAVPYRGLSVLASQGDIFPTLPESASPAPAVSKFQTKHWSDDDDDEDDEDEDEDSGVSDSDSPSSSHIPKDRRAGVGNESRGKKRSQLAMLS